MQGAAFGIAGVIAAIMVLYTGVNLQRAPVQALVADVVPSRYRSLATLPEAIPIPMTSRAHAPFRLPRPTFIIAPPSFRRPYLDRHRRSTGAPTSSPFFVPRREARRAGRPAAGPWPATRRESR